MGIVPKKNCHKEPSIKAEREEGEIERAKDTLSGGKIPSLNGIMNLMWGEKKNDRWIYNRHISTRNLGRNLWTLKKLIPCGGEEKSSQSDFPRGNRRATHTRVQRGVKKGQGREVGQSHVGKITHQLVERNSEATHDHSVSW